MKSVVISYNFCLYVKKKHEKQHIDYETENTMGHIPHAVHATRE